MIKPKKSLGQNFLTDQNILEKITRITQIKKKPILEVGPGTGNLTLHILKNNPKKIFLVEKDEKLVSFLKEKFKDKDKITIINDDILRIDEKKLYKEKLIVFGNLPYNISTEILCKWILNLHDDKFWFECLILMFQKEVADRIISNFNSNKYGRLSILSRWKFEVDKVCDVKPNSFYPKPKVDSSVLYFKPKKNYYNFKNPKNLEMITRVFFNQRRKMLKKPFNQIFNGNMEIANKMMIDLNLRPQNLDHDTYYKITKEFENL